MAKKRYLEMARLTKPVGLKGEMRAQLLCDDAELLAEFDLYLGEAKIPVTVTKATPIKGDMCKLFIKGTDSVEAAQKLAGKLLYIDREDAELPENTYFIADIIGLEVFDTETGELYGIVDDVLQNSPTDVYSVKTPSGGRLMFPVIDEVVNEIDVDGGKILITPLDGLFDPEEIRDEPKTSEENEDED